MSHSRIEDVTTTLLTGPSTHDPFLRAARPLRSAALIEVRLANGATGLGETYAGYFCPEVVPAIVDFFRPVLVGQTVEDIPELWRRMVHCGDYWCRVGVGLAVVNGLEAALWDLRGKLEGKPVCELLGGAKHDSLACYATGGPSNFPLDRLVAKIEHYLSLGFRAVKLGAGSYSSETGFTGHTETRQAAEFEARKVEFVRQRFGAGLGLMLDGHMGNSPFGVWSTDTAEAVLEAVAPYNLVFFEEPLHYSNVEGYTHLSRTQKTPIAGGETLTGTTEWKWFIAHDCFNIGQPDAAFTGGLGEVLEVARLLAEKGRGIATHAWGAGPALMQNIHCGFAAPNTRILEVPPDYGPLHSELIGDSFRMENGRVLPPQTPGLGVRLTEETKRRFPFVPGSGEFNSVPGKKCD